MIDPKRFQPEAEPGAKTAGYVYSEELKLAIRVALAAGRPLLLRGAPGTGKTTMAKDFARTLRAAREGEPAGADYYQEVVTSRTEARDLEWRFDAIRRLADAQLATEQGRVAAPSNYIEPRALWWAFAPETAREHGGLARDPLQEQGGSSLDRPAVVLIDEIDKAEPEVANDLLEPFDIQAFTVAETGLQVNRKREVVLIVTTNDERDLPAAFLRRCVVHELQRPGPAVLERIARSHLGTELGDAKVARVIERVSTLAAEASEQRLRAPGTAEFLDALRAVETLEPPDEVEWNAITRLAMWKHPAKKERT